MNKTLFHLAFPLNNIEQTKAFYGGGLGCEIGRETSNSIIMNLYGHQIVAHVNKEPLTPQNGIYPRHFGLIFTSETDWENLLDAAQQKHLKFYQEPKRRFPGLPTEHRTFFLEDPFDNLLEFKYYCYPEAVLGCNEYAQVGDV
ncbi:MAG TPA: glyoxalase [Planktothrix sp. UBA8402]|nr:glyoxalase [Planktothrix sp. UBA8402]